MLFCLLTRWINLYNVIYKGILRNDICFITDCFFRIRVKCGLNVTKLIEMKRI